MTIEFEPPPAADGNPEPGDQSEATGRAAHGQLPPPPPPIPTEIAAMMNANAQGYAPVETHVVSRSLGAPAGGSVGAFPGRAPERPVGAGTVVIGSLAIVCGVGGLDPRDGSLFAIIAAILGTVAYEKSRRHPMHGAAGAAKVLGVGAITLALLGFLGPLILPAI